MSFANYIFILYNIPTFSTVSFVYINSPPFLLLLSIGAYINMVDWNIIRSYDSWSNVSNPYPTGRAVHNHHDNTSASHNI